MPRAAYTPKNRYCWNSNVSEAMFLAILNQWCRGQTATKAVSVVNRWARLNGGRKVSRQTVNNYFNRIAFKLRTERYEQIDEMNYGERPTDSLYAEYPKYFYDELWRIGVNPMSSRQGPAIRVLQPRSKKMRGFRRLKRFNHLAYAYLYKEFEQETDQDTAREMYIFMEDWLRKSPIEGVITRAQVPDGMMIYNGSEI